MSDTTRHELPGQRTYFSKTYCNPEDDTYTAEISAGYIHYQAANGTFQEINTNLRPEPDGSYAVEEGLCKVRFGRATRQNDDDVSNEDSK